MEHFRAIWISDIHLGTKGCQAKKLLDFLKTHSADTLYLVGDIVDMWALSRKIYFPKSHVNVMKKILTLSKNTTIYYVRGNHDEALDHFVPFDIGNIKVVKDVVHTTATGHRLLVCHGDKYDQVIQYAKWVAILGDIGYTILLKSNAWVNWIRRRFGFGYWSLSAYAKKTVKGVVSFIGDFEQAVIKDVKAQGFDGVVCGHIHQAEIKILDGVWYINDGDWVESCTAAVEHMNGDLEIISFAGVDNENTNNN